MAEKKGLPPSFDLNITSRNEPPVKLGDYLDDVDGPSSASRVAQKRQADEGKVIEMPRAAMPLREDLPIAEAEEHLPSDEVTPKKQRRKKRKGPIRKQINATPETLKMIEELIEHVRTYSEQKDAKASEVFHALVLALHEAREFIELGDVPERGRWGTPTAKAFPISLKNAFQEAIAAAYRKHRR